MKIQIISAIFACFVAAANWNSTTIYEQVSSTTRTSFDGAGFVALLSLVALLFISRSIYRSFRLCLERGIRVPASAKFIEMWPCLFLAPLFISYSISTTDSSVGGVVITHTWDYGSHWSIYALVVVAITIAALQFRSGLDRFIRSAGNA